MSDTARLDALEALEAIRRCKAGYFRCIDTKDWAGLDVVLHQDIHLVVPEAGADLRGRARVVRTLAAVLDGVVTVHHGHLPELTLLDEQTATGIWAMDDELWFPDGSAQRGRGHYHETYRRTADGWRIAALRLERLRLERRAAPTAPWMVV